MICSDSSCYFDDIAFILQKEEYWVKTSLLMYVFCMIPRTSGKYERYKKTSWVVLVHLNILHTTALTEGIQSFQSIGSYILSALFLFPCAWPWWILHFTFHSQCQRQITNDSSPVPHGWDPEHSEHVVFPVSYSNSFFSSCLSLMGGYLLSYCTTPSFVSLLIISPVTDSWWIWLQAPRDIHLQHTHSFRLSISFPLLSRGCSGDQCSGWRGKKKKNDITLVAHFILPLCSRETICTLQYETRNI